MFNAIKNVTKMFILSTLALEMFAALYHCACAPISNTMQMALGAVLLFDLLAAPILAPAKD